MAALRAGPPPPVCRWVRRSHRGATACRLLERDDRVIDGLEPSPGVYVWGIPPLSHRIFAIPLHPCIDSYLAILQQIHCIPMYPAVSVRI